MPCLGTSFDVIRSTVEVSRSKISFPVARRDHSSSENKKRLTALSKDTHHDQFHGGVLKTKGQDLPAIMQTYEIFNYKTDFDKCNHIRPKRVDQIFLIHSCYDCKFRTHIPTNVLRSVSSAVVIPDKF